MKIHPLLIKLNCFEIKKLIGQSKKRKTNMQLEKHGIIKINTLEAVDIAKYLHLSLSFRCS